jgi:hypothetical protein
VYVRLFSSLDRPARGTLVAAMLPATPPDAARAQVIEVAPLLGVHVPRAHLVVDTVKEPGVDAYTLTGSTVGHASSPLGSVQVAAWFGRWFALEVGGGFAPSAMATRSYSCEWTIVNRSRNDCISETRRSAYVLMGSARLLVAMKPLDTRPLRPSVYLLAGWGVADQGGAGFHAAEQTAGHALEGAVRVSAHSRPAAAGGLAGEHEARTAVVSLGRAPGADAGAAAQAHGVAPGVRPDTDRGRPALKHGLRP